jgi:hypothetical protein
MVPFRGMLLTLQSGLESLAPRAHGVPVYSKAFLHSHIALSRRTAYTNLGSCRLAGVDPLEYLRDILPRMTRRIPLVELSELLPSHWAAARAAAQTAAT